MNDLQRLCQIDTDKFKYVWNERDTYVAVIIRCPHTLKRIVARVHLPFGLLADGATGVKDLKLIAFFTHDRLYASPVATTLDGRTIRLTKKQCDMIYFQLLMEGHPLRSWVRFRGLYGWKVCGVRVPPTACISWKIWDRYRKQEELDADWWLKGQVVPKALTEWNFPTCFTEDAVYVGG